MRVVDDAERIAREWLERFDPEEIIVFAHGDHDGQGPAAYFRYKLGNVEVRFSQPFRPKEIPPTEGKKLFVILDLQMSEKQIEELLRRGLYVINMDHHDVRHIENPRYLLLNPKHVYGKEYISSSGLVWKIFKPGEIAWALGAGSAGDIAVEHVPDLFEEIHRRYPELLPGTSLKDIYSSKVYEIAQILLMAFDNPYRGLELLLRSFRDGWQVLYDSELYKKYLEKKRYLQEFFKRNPHRVLEHDKFVLIDSSGHPYPGSYSGYLNLQNGDGRVYIEYDQGRLHFRNFFGSYDVREIARLFGGGGPHGRSGGAFTTKSFAEVFDTVRRHFETRQTRLSDFRA